MSCLTSGSVSAAYKIGAVASPSDMSAIAGFPSVFFFLKNKLHHYKKKTQSAAEWRKTQKRGNNRNKRKKKTQQKTQSATEWRKKQKRRNSRNRRRKIKEATAGGEHTRRCLHVVMGEMGMRSVRFGEGTPTKGHQHDASEKRPRGQTMSRGNDRLGETAIPKNRKIRHRHAGLQKSPKYHNIASRLPYPTTLSDYYLVLGQANAQTKSTSTDPTRHICEDGSRSSATYCTTAGEVKAKKTRSKTNRRQQKRPTSG